MNSVSRLPINDPNMLRMIREISQQTSNVYFLKHAKSRMRQRKITSSQIYSCLRGGSIYESAHVDIRGDWRCTLHHSYAGDLVYVAVAIKCNDQGKLIAIITVF